MKRVVRGIVDPAFSIRSMGQTRALTLSQSLLLQYLGQQHTVMVSLSAVIAKGYYGEVGSLR